MFKLVTFLSHSDRLEPEVVEGVQEYVMPHHEELLPVHLSYPLQRQVDYIIKISKELKA